MRQATTDEIEALPYNLPFKNSTLTLFFAEDSDQFMVDANLIRKSESTDKNHSTGAIVVKDGIVLSAEANQSGFKDPWLIELHQKWMCIRKWLKVKSGSKYWLCPGCSKAYHHAESRASREASENHGDKVRGATIYLAGHYWCCKPCSDEMVKAGIKNVVLEEGAARKYKKR